MVDQEINLRKQRSGIDLGRAIARMLFETFGDLISWRVRRRRDHEMSVTASAAAGGLPAKFLRV